MAAPPITSNLQEPSEASSEKQGPVSIASKQDEANGPDHLDNPHFKDLQRSLRNALKKLNATAKVDAIIAEHPGKSLDELVEEKKINADQKAQALKKPALQASIVQIEEQLAQFKSFANHYEERLVSQKAALEQAHKEELDAVREKAVAQSAEATKKDLRERLLSLSKFLCAAAAMRRSGDETSSESRAFEGVLYQVYGGTQDAVTSMIKLIDGVDEKIVSVEGETLDITYRKVKLTSEEYAPTEVATDAAATSDPTLVNAGYTELQDTTFGGTAAATEFTPQSEVPPPAQTLVTNAANPVAESAWDSNAAASIESSANGDSWVEVPRDLSETDASPQATVAVAEATGHNEEDDPVSKVQSGDKPHHHRQHSGRGRGRGGRGRGEGFRGRGRGEGRGRGHGHGHGGHGGHGGRGGRGGRGRGGPNGAPAAAHS